MGCFLFCFFVVWCLRLLDVNSHVNEASMRANSWMSVSRAVRSRLVMDVKLLWARLDMRSWVVS